MRQFLKLAPVLIVLALAAGSTPANAAGDTGKGGVSCTYDLCMKRCTGMSGAQCNKYCDKVLIERKTSGACKS